MKLKFAKSMPQWPHWWVLRENGSAREFDFVKRLIKEFGYQDPWGTRTEYSLVIGRFKYWVDEDCLNRGAPISNEEVRKRGARWLARYGKKIGPYGRLMNDSTMRRKRPRNKTSETKDTWHDLGERVHDLPNTRSDMTIKPLKRAVAKFLRDDIGPSQIHFTPKGVHLCNECRRKTDVRTLKELI